MLQTRKRGHTLVTQSDVVFSDISTISNISVGRIVAQATSPDVRRSLALINIARRMPPPATRAGLLLLRRAGEESDAGYPLGRAVSKKPRTPARYAEAPLPAVWGDIRLAPTISLFRMSIPRPARTIPSIGLIFAGLFPLGEAIDSGRPILYFTVLSTL